MKLSIIIPSYRESENLTTLLPYLRSEIKKEDEIIVVEACTETEDVEEALKEKLVKSEKKCRAFQLNKGAKLAKGNVLYFVHADTQPPKGFRSDILNAVSNNHYYGCFPFQFNSKKWYLKVNAFTTRFNFLYFRGGDQSLFVTRDFYEKLGGFDEYYTIMEEYDFFRRARKFSPIYIMKQKRIRVSARKYDNNSYLRVNWANFLAVRMFKRGKKPDEIKERYAKILNQEIKRY